MHWEFAEITYPTAKKDYQCEASHWLKAYPISEYRLTPAEQLSIKQAKADNWKIASGQRYIKIRGKWDGEWHTFKARIDIDKICHRYGIYKYANEWSQLRGADPQKWDLCTEGYESAIEFLYHL